MEHGITYDLLGKPKSDLYVSALALLNSGRIELLDHPRAIAQLAGLERRTARGGRDSVDHFPGGHDDLANVICALAVQLAAPQAENWVTWGGPNDIWPESPPPTPLWLRREQEEREDRMRIINGNTAGEQERRRKEATRIMYHMLGKTSPLLWSE